MFYQMMINGLEKKNVRKNDKELGPTGLVVLGIKLVREVPSEKMTFEQKPGDQGIPGSIKTDSWALRGHMAGVPSNQV